MGTCFWGKENVLKLIAEMAAQFCAYSVHFCEYTENH